MLRRSDHTSNARSLASLSRCTIDAPELSIGPNASPPYTGSKSSSEEVEKFLDKQACSSQEDTGKLEPTHLSCNLRCLELRFAVRNDSNRHRFAAISNRTIRIARPKPVRVAVKALLP